MTHQKNRTIRLITTKSACCPVRFALAHRRIFSYLAYRSRVGQGDSQRELARQTVTDPRTTKNVLAFLAERKLVVCQCGKWYANEPSGEVRNWFAENKAPKYHKHWSDRFCYSSLLVPCRMARSHCGSNKRFTINHAHVYSILQSLSRSNKRKPGVVERIGVSRLSRMLNGLSPKTIRSVLNVLESLGLVICYQDGVYETIHVCPLNEEHEGLFKKAEPKRESKRPQKDEGQQELRFRSEESQSVYNDCRREGFAIDLAKEITVAAAMAGIDSMAFSGYSELAAIEHAKSRLAGKVTVSHHGHLLKYKLEQIRSEQDRIEKRMMESCVPNEPKVECPPGGKLNGETKPSSRSHRKRPQPEQHSEELERQISHELVHTKAWLRHKLGRPATGADIVATTQDGRMKAWCIEGRISPFFLVVSPLVREAVGGKPLNEVFGPKCSCEYSQSIKEAIQAKYDDIFGDLSAANANPVAADPVEADEEVIEGMTQRQFAEALAGL